MVNKKDITGLKFGILTAIRPTKYRSHGQIVWEFKCECGNVCYKAKNQMSRNTPNCGCLTTNKFKVNGYNSIKTLTADCINNTKASQLKRKINSNNTSGFKGVYWAKHDKSWRAQITFKKKIYHLGCYKNIEDAIKVRKQAEEMMFEPFLEWYEEQKIKSKPLVGEHIGGIIKKMDD